MKTQLFDSRKAKHLIHTIRFIRRAQAFKPEFDILPYIHVREEGIFLEHVPIFASEGAGYFLLAIEI